jgi:hypothetical protein
MEGEYYGMIQTFHWNKRVGKRLLERPRDRWKNNIIMELRETGLEVVDWILLA